MHHQAVTAPRQVWRNGADGKLDDGPQIDVGSPQRFLADVAMRGFKQVVDVPGHLAYMPLDENARAFDVVGRGRVPQQPRGVAHDGQ